MKTLNRLALARPMVLCGVLLFFYSAFRAPHSAFGQTLTTVSDTLRNADGTLASGKLRIFWKNFAFTESGATYAIGAGNKEITVTAGDRVVIEIGFNNTLAGTSITGTGNFGDNSATDLADNETGTAADNPFVELSQTLTFQASTVKPARRFS